MFEKKRIFLKTTLVLLGQLLACGVGIGIQVKETQQAKTALQAKESKKYLT